MDAFHYLYIHLFMCLFLKLHKIEASVSNLMTAFLNTFKLLYIFLLSFTRAKLRAEADKK